jgi:hypothetical protein
MTVCLAALCTNDEAPHAVVVADRMVTLGGFMEFEHTIPKMSAASASSIAMIAGDSLVGSRLAGQVSEALSQSASPVEEIAQHFARDYAEIRRARMTEDLLAPRALDLQSFYGAHASLQANIVAMIDNQMAQYNLGVEVLLAGVDQKGAHAFTVQNPGGAERLHDFIGYAAIGSGAIHAVQSMVGFGHSPEAPYHTTVFRAYASKRRAEVAPGVGNDTDMAVISQQAIHWLTDGEKDQLEKISQSFRRRPPPNSKASWRTSTSARGTTMDPVHLQPDGSEHTPMIGSDPESVVRAMVVQAELMAHQPLPLGHDVRQMNAVRDLSPLGR